MRLPPLDVLLTWPAPNYVDPPTRGNACLIVNVVFITLVLITVALRFYCRLAAGTILRWGVDDYMILLALFWTLVLTALVISAETTYGWNLHVWDIPVHLVTKANIIAFLAKLVFVLAATFTRLSLCAFYYRLVQDSGIMWFKNVIHVTNAFTVATCVAFLFLGVFLCTPVKFYWEFPPTVPGTCLDEGKATLAAGIVNLVNDLLCTIIPIPLIMRLHMPLRQRISVCVLFSLGFIVLVAGTVRTYYIWEAFMQSYDETWMAYPLWICAAVEIDVGVICACAPALKSLLKLTQQARSQHQASSRDRSQTTPAVSDLKNYSNPTSSISGSASAKKGIFKFNVTPAINWSLKPTPSHPRGSVRLPSLEERGLELESRRSQKVSMHASSAPAEETEPEKRERQWNDSEWSGRGIMRRQSVELSSLRTASSAGMGTEKGRGGGWVSGAEEEIRRLPS
ncbi:hypothetical protein LTR62_008824 [Meristemomyces frigidus]|uniref:Rhodopsin domain-containing protein n=1 Tax=Meristemomyces frigidus TaxID=1508187 RepID=A0AAN7TA82_9PEZI|nr:hypothetical protein LTR62_008824 [Meristemomyces frigidus]